MAQLSGALWLRYQCKERDPVTRKLFARKFDQAQGLVSGGGIRDAQITLGDPLMFHGTTQAKGRHDTSSCLVINYKYIYIYICNQNILYIW